MNFNGSSADIPGRYPDMFSCYLFYLLAYSRSLVSLFAVTAQYPHGHLVCTIHDQTESDGGANGACQMR